MFQPPTDKPLNSLGILDAQSVLDRYPIPKSDPTHSRPTRSLRILQMGSTAYRGGVATAITTLCKTLHQQDHDVWLVCDGGDINPLRAQGIPCTVTDFAQRPGAIARGAWDVHRVMREFRPDVVHVHGRAPALRSYLAGRIPDWFTLHNTQFTERVGMMDIGVLRRWLSPKGRRFFVLNDEARAYLQRSMGVSPSKVEIVFNGVDCDRYHAPTAAERHQARAQFGLKRDQTAVLFVGRMHPSKQPLAVVEAAKAMRQAGRDDVQFILVGEGELTDAVQQAIAGLGLEATCKVYGWMDPRQAYYASDLLVMPSLYEGFPMAAIEALATGLPVLRSRTGGAAETIVEGKTGFCCGTTVSEFVDCLMRVLAQPQHLIPMRATARQWAEQRLSAQAQAKLLIQHYQTHLGRRR